MKNPRVVAVVQARMASTRLPGKVMRGVGGMPLLELLLRRLLMAKSIQGVVLATTDDPTDSILADHMESLGIECFRGSSEDVLERTLFAALQADADVIVRVTGDCPLVDPGIVDSAVGTFLDSECDYLGSGDKATFPDGLDVEVLTLEAMKLSYQSASSKYDREHVTSYIRSSENFSKRTFSASEDYSSIRLTLDEPEDLKVISAIVEHFLPDIYFPWSEVISLYEAQPQIFRSNGQFKRNEGAVMSDGQKLWRRARKVIPGGNMLLSKRPEMYLPNLWPTYFKKAKGCFVWDLEDNKYIDMSLMGVGTNSLGYGNTEVDEVVNEVVNSGNMSTLNCPEEVLLAEKLVALHPWSQMVRFARTGGEANSIAIRIARAASGKDGVAVCGYHGWHDWYLAMNLSERDNLESHLLPGLSPDGVPKNLAGSIFGFEYNDIDALSKLIAERSIGTIKMEVERNIAPNPHFLNQVRELATKNRIVLIFDECSSGFRETFGGLHKKYQVEPDIAIFGKALGNGYAITAVIGRQEVMDYAQNTFISSTFWTERIGSAAALKTLEIMEREKSWEFITQRGRNYRSRMEQLAQKYKINLELFGILALTSFRFCYPTPDSYKTFVTQEMLKRGFLAGTSVYFCTQHTDTVFNAYFAALEEVFSLIRSHILNGNDISHELDTDVCHSGFQRLN